VRGRVRVVQRDGDANISLQEQSEGSHPPPLCCNCPRWRRRSECGMVTAHAPWHQQGAMLEESRGSVEAQARDEDTRKAVAQRRHRCKAGHGSASC
jgi:hypothetical protein